MNEKTKPSEISVTLIRFQGSFQDPLATKRPSGNKVKKTMNFIEIIVFRVVRRLVVRDGWRGKGGTYVAPSTTMESKTVGGRRRRLPTVLEAAEGRPIMVDGATYGTIYPIMYGTRT